MLAVTKNGNVITPAIMLCPNIKQGKEERKYQGVDAFVCQSRNGEVDESVLAKWASLYVFPLFVGKKSMLILENDPTYMQDTFYRVFSKGGIFVKYLPEGVSCVVSPFRKIRSVFERDVMKLAHQSKCAYTLYKKIGQYDVLKWFLDGLAKLRTEHIDLLTSAFDFNN